ncbi:MAG: metallopeptidase TldD-related protein [Candidatus Sumerlaeota bacterium]|nr:metallopeptidase TldD-related protein [Candidatus Sumerlaeota bacterium]
MGKLFDEWENILTFSQHALTRFTQNYIHQNMAGESSEAQIRIIKDGREGTFTTNGIENAGAMRDAFQTAIKIALAQKPDKTFPGLPHGRHINFQTVSPATEKCTPARRASIVKKIIRLARQHKMEAAGALATKTILLHISNSNGVKSLQHSTTAELNLVMSNGQFSGYSYWVGSDINEMPVEQLAEEAIQKCLYKGEPLAVEPGEWTVVLSPYAAAMIVKFLAYMGFSAKAFIEKRSFMNKLMDKKVAARGVTIYDDGLAPDGVPRAFDYEGVPKKKVYFIKNGVAAGLVHDSRTAAKMGVKNTGHALPAPNAMGPFALNLFMAPGKTSEEQIIANVERGIYVTKIHYPGILEPVSTVMTGMTKDGTFLIENGRLTKPIRNLRFTQSLLEAFSNVEAIGAERRCLAAYFGAATAPALRIADFHFTGVSTI